MKIKLTDHQKTRCGVIGAFSMLSVLFGTAMGVPIVGDGLKDSPPEQKPKKAIRRTATSYQPSGYEQVGSTQLYSRVTEYIDFFGYFDGYYYGSTYSNRGYKVALQVNRGNYSEMNCLYGGAVDGVSFSANV